MGEDFQIEMVCCTSTISDEVAAGLRQKDVAVSYALALRSVMR